MFLFGNSIDSIIAPLAKLEAKLQNYITAQSVKFDKNKDTIILLKVANDDILAEQTRAAQIKENLKKLLASV